MKGHLSFREISFEICFISKPLNLIHLLQAMLQPGKVKTEV